MNTLQFDLSKEYGIFKPMNAVNNGPVHKRHATDQASSNLEAYKAAKIPYARNHDAAFCSSYGGEFTVDISAIFKDFSADENDPASYDFACTDEYIAVTLEAGTETFYRLGQKIEHEIKKHYTLPPKDFHKWAVICEHIIRHYNEGWANGFQYNIQYWEIWNEPDLDRDDSPNKRTWGGTKKQFFDLFEIASKHLKERFPDLMIGGPALAHSEEWAAEFLAEMSRRNVPMDFFSWHIYCREPEKIVAKAERLKALLVQNGYGDTESILNEWNYIKNWKDQYIYSIQTIIGLKGASFTAACMCEAQKSPIDMLMYYDARPSVFNGLFDYYTKKPLKGYYPFAWYGGFYDGYREIRSEDTIENIYSLCGKNVEGKVRCMLTYYSDDDSMGEKEISLDFGKKAEYKVSVLNNESDSVKEIKQDKLSLVLKIHETVLVEEI